MSVRTAWIRRPIPPVRKRCYRLKANALNVFRDANRHIIERYGGETYNVSPSEFDAINHKYGLRGRRRVRNIAEALWEALRGGRPYCLTDIDLDALNDTSPAREAEAEMGVRFELPDFVHTLPPYEKPPPRPKAPPRNWRSRCASWSRQDRLVRKQLTDDCFVDRAGHEKCVCRKGGRFVECTPGGHVPGVPF